MAVHLWEAPLSPDRFRIKKSTCLLEQDRPASEIGSGGCHPASRPPPPRPVRRADVHQAGQCGSCGPGHDCADG